jgi:hypothetical protein
MGKFKITFYQSICVKRSVEVEADDEDLAVDKFYDELDTLIELSTKIDEDIEDTDIDDIDEVTEED